MLREVSLSVLAFREAVLARQQVQYELGERMKELACLFDVTRLTELDDLSLDELLSSVAQRLPAAMRYPEMAVASIDHDGRHYGGDTAGEILRVEFNVEPGQVSWVTLSYSRSLPPGAGAAFLDQEREMLEAIARRLAGVIGRRRVMAADRDNQALMHGVFEEAPHAIYVVDPSDMSFVMVNQAACRLLDYTRTQFLALKLFDIQAEIERDVLPSRVEQVMAAGSKEFENRYRRQDGRIIDTQLSARAVRLKGRDYMIVAWRDITAEKAAIAEIRKLSLAVEQSPESIVITNLNAEIEYVNQAFQQVTGYTREEALGLNPSVLKSGRTPASTYDDMWATLLRG